MTTVDRKKLVERTKRVVIKLGTAVLMQDDQSGIALSRFYSFVESIAALKQQGKQVLLVTSGAVGLGAKRLGLGKKPKLLPQKQACAAVGQGHLMAMYADAFARFDIITAQILVTEEDFSNRQRYLNLRSCIAELLEHGVLPIFNENDAVSTAELEALKSDASVKVNFGDNDKLSALVANKTEADLLVILTDVSGLYTGDPRSDEQAELISIVEQISPEIERLADGGKGETAGVGRGGMKTKLSAAKVATQSGCAAIIAGGKIPGVIDKVFHGEEVGTLFLPGTTPKGKQRWIAFATTVRASVAINEGARNALVAKKASLLPAGVTEVKGMFDRGDVVSIIDADGREFARGIVNYSSDEAKKISGLHSAAIGEHVEQRNYDALITRDNIAFLEGQ
ncbi:MAG TPA: glutamate 5-kinase [Planktothrix sp.]|jgi:glutamate 5-kinase